MVAASETNQALANELDRAAVVEKDLLGCCLWSSVHSGDGLDRAAEILTPADFGVWVHGVVFAACLELRAANYPVTAATVYERMSAAGTLAELGPNPAVWFADVLESVATDAHAEYLASRVKELADRRKLRHAALSILDRVQREADRPAADTLADCEQLLFDVGGNGDRNSGPRQAAELVREALARIDNLASGESDPGIPTGFSDLDTILGGLKPGQVVVIGARPGVGKTALGIGIASNAAASAHGALIFSMEMPRAELMERLLAMRSGVPLRVIQAGRGMSGEQAERVSKAADVLAKQPFEIDDTPNLTVARIASAVRNAVRRHGVRLVVLDYLQLVSPENPKDNRVQQVGAAARQLKLLARSCNVPIIVLCQLNRESENRPDGKPRLSDLRESGAIEQDADIVVLLHKHPNQADELPVLFVDAIVAKNRNGPQGETALAYCRGITRFQNATK
jgi:replicative DNA helicase